VVCVDLYWAVLGLSVGMVLSTHRIPHQLIVTIMANLSAWPLGASQEGTQTEQPAGSFPKVGTVSAEGTFNPHLDLPCLSLSIYLF
jgi:hypothetical protein